MPEKPAPRLGRGLSALIPPQGAPAPRPTPSAPASDSGVQEIALADIQTNPRQPRTEFEDAALEELADSIKAHGVLQPVMVRPRGGGRYELVAGERRYRASRIAGRTHIPAVVRALTDEESLTVALIENIQREDLNPMEAARGYKQLLDEYGLTQTELGRQIGKKQSTISNAMRLLNLPAEMQDSIADGRLTEAHGKVLLSIADPRKRRDVWQDALAMQWSVKQTEEQAALAELLTSGAKARIKPSRATPARDIHWDDLLARVRDAFHLKVAVKTRPNGGGTLLLDFSSPEEIEGVLDRLK
jgi:ParB family chromosome partitioning protein